MALSDPVAVYNAANNSEVYHVQDALAAAGIEAYVTEDASPAGLWSLGMLPGIHKPQVWVERADVEKSQPVLAEFERRKIELQAKSEGVQLSDVGARCEECDEVSAFPAGQAGSVQECPHCGAFMDVVGAKDGDWVEADFDLDDDANRATE